MGTFLLPTLPLVMVSADHETCRSKTPTLRDLHSKIDRAQSRPRVQLARRRHRHDQACWAAEMFLQEWGTMAPELGWTPEDIFSHDSGLAYWLETEIVTALGPCA
jgi:hypothetical protein